MPKKPPHRYNPLTESHIECSNKPVPFQWPKNFFDFIPIDDPPNFKALREDLKKCPPNDPLE